LGGAVCTVAMLTASFAALILGAFLLGLFSAFGQYYRFAAIDAAKTPQERTSAMAVVTGAGVIGGIAGPYLGGSFADALASTPFAGAFIVLAAICVALAASQSLLSADLGRDAGAGATTAGARLAVNGGFLKASAICAVGFSVMTLTMNAAPLSIQQCGYSLPASAGVLQVHFALMYLPSFLNPQLVAWLGLRGLIVCGIVAGAIGCFLTAVTDQTLAVFVIELGLSGIAWNFIFNGGTLLLANTYPPAAKTRAQGINSLVVYSANLAASFSAGALWAFQGWAVVNLVCLPLLVLAIAALWPRAAKVAVPVG
jgi:MFS family permease